MSQVCYFCTTPFQIMTVIHLYYNQKDKIVADLYVVDQFSHAKNIVEKISQLNLFRKTILVCERDIVNKEKSSKFALWPQMIMNYLHLNKSAKKILKENADVQYDTMYISSKAFTCRLVALYYAKNDFNTEIVYFDDGLGSYYNPKTIFPRKADKLLRKFLLGGKAGLVDPKRLLLYAPDLFHNSKNHAGKDLIVEKIPKWKRNDTCTEIMNNVFGFSKQDSIQEPVIIFDSLYKGEEKERLNEFYLKVAETVGKDNVIVKKHPRDTESGPEGITYYKNSSLPFELICQNEEMSKKLLIAVATTAVITPILLFEEEPNVLIVNNIQGMTNNHSNACYSDFKQMYLEKDRFYEATSIDDALQFLQNFNEKYIENLLDH